jgi:aminomethyltransferase
MSGMKKTALYALHKSLGARMAPFAGYEMPIQYPSGIMKEHLHTRTAAGLFDVSHMRQVSFFGEDALAFLEWVLPADIKALATNQARLSMILNDKAGVIDDCIVRKDTDRLSVVLNAGCADKDLVHIRAKLGEFGKRVTLEEYTMSLLALQGPKAMAVLGQYVPDIDKLPFMYGRAGNVAGIPVHITRCGYTGEDGFEISVADNKAEELTSIFLKSSDVQLIGLGARDSLRLEAGLNLYGHELNEDINPVAARIMWCITKRRLAEGGYIGHENVLKFRDDQALVPQLRSGIISTGPVARENTNVLINGKKVGTVTSGCPSPSLGKNIAIAYLDRDVSKKGTKVELEVRGKLVAGEVTTTPFVPTRYYKVA